MPAYLTDDKRTYLLTRSDTGQADPILESLVELGLIKRMVKASAEQEVTDLVFLARNGVGRRARPQRLLERTVESVKPNGQSKEGPKLTKTVKVWSTWSEQRTKSENAALELQKAHQHSSCKRLTKATHELHQGTRARSSRTLAHQPTTLSIGKQ